MASYVVLKPVENAVAMIEIAADVCGNNDLENCFLDSQMKNL